MFSHFLRKLGTLGSRPHPETVRVGGLVWHAADPQLLPHLPALFTSPSKVVKENHQRTVLRVELPAGALYVKRIRANTPRAWAREILRPPKARLEFENAMRLRALNIPTAEPVGWAEADSFWPGESVVVTREVAGSVPLDEYLTDSLSAAERRRIAAGLGRLFAAMHSAGVAHPDPHPGNFLFVQATGEFVLLDVHAVGFELLLLWSHTRDNLVLFNRWFQLRASRADRARFWRAYCEAMPTDQRPLVPRGRGGEIELHTSLSNRRFWAARHDRYLGTNRQFRRVKGKGVRGHAVRDLPDDLVRGWLADPDAVFSREGVGVLKDSKSSTVVLAGGVLWKRFRLKRPLDAVKNLFRRSEALRSWVFGHGLLDRHLPTPRPLFVAHRYRFGIPCEGYVAFEVVPDAVELPVAVAASDGIELRRLCDVLGRLVRTLHDRGVSHRDLKAPNVLLSGPDRRPVLIDLVGLAVHTEVPDRLRRRDLARLNAGFLLSSEVSRTVRLRLLLAYLRAWPRRADVWKAWWRAIAAATAEKVRKNAKSGRPLA